MMFFVIVTIGDVHSHMCLDGQEPAVSFHFENLSGHPEHGMDEQSHNDYEYELTANTLKAKSLDYGFYLLSSELSVHSFVFSGQQLFVSTPAELFGKDDAASLLPPLRAPPVIA